MPAAAAGRWLGIVAAWPSPAPTTLVSCPILPNCPLTSLHLRLSDLRHLHLLVVLRLMAMVKRARSSEQKAEALFESLNVSKKKL